MGLKQQAGEPWGIAVALGLGGLIGALTAVAAPVALIGVPVGLAMAVGVYLAKVGLAVLLERGREAEPPATGLPVPRRGSPADDWLRRATRALTRVREQTGAVAPGLRPALADVAERAAAVLTDLYRLGGQVTLVERELDRVDPGELTGAAQRLREEARNSSGAVHEEKSRAARAAQERLDVYERLAGVRREQLAQLESATLGLEGLSARLAELLALPSGAVPGAAALPGSAGAGIGELTDELDGLRAGLAESQALSLRVLAPGNPTREDGATPGTGPV
jgi:hypothetical protein